MFNQQEISPNNLTITEHCPRIQNANITNEYSRNMAVDKLPALDETSRELLKKRRQNAAHKWCDFFLQKSLGTSAESRLRCTEIEVSDVKQVRALHSLISWANPQAGT